MELGKPENIVYIFILIPIALALGFGLRKKIRIAGIMAVKINKAAKIIKIVFMAAGIALIAFSLLGPQVAKGDIKTEKRALDIYFLVDVSKSMNVDDIKPSRMESAKETMVGIIDKLKGDRVGIIPFSSDAYIQMPFTDDYDMAELFVSVIDTELISGGGTNIAKALELAKASFGRGGSGGEKVVIIISDGEDHYEDKILSAAGSGELKIFTIGVGTEKGALIPDIIDGKPAGYKKDETGNYVVSKLGVNALTKLAEAGKGKYIKSAGNGKEVEMVVNELTFIKRELKGYDNKKDYQKLYQYFAGLGLILLMAGYFTGSGRIKTKAGDA